MSGWRAGIVAALIGGVVLFVGWLITGLGGDDDGNGGASETVATGSGGLPVLACAAELDEVCRTLAAELGTPMVRYTPGSEVTGDIVVLAATGDLPEGLDPTVVARSPIVITVWRERALVLGAACNGTVDPDCLAEAYGMQWEELGGNAAWGAFKLGLADPTGSEPAMLAWSLLATGGVPGGLADSLRLVADDTGALLVELVQFGDSRADMVVAPEVAAAAQLENAVGRGGRLELYYPAAPWVEYSAAGSGREADRVVERLLESDMQRRLGALGLRPAQGEATGLLDGLGEPAEPAPPPDEPTRARLIEAWDGLG